MIPRMYRSIPAGIDRYFTDEHPLGPVAAEHVQDIHVAAFLLNPETAAFKNVMSGASILLGRRGAGKSALLYMLNERDELQKHLHKYFANSNTVRELGENSELHKDYFGTVWIDAPLEMAEVDRIIRQQRFPTLESAADAWRKRILYNILLYFLNEKNARRPLSHRLRKLLLSIEDIRKPNQSKLKVRSLLEAIRDAHINRNELLDLIESELVKSRKRFLVIVDTMEEYRIRDAAVSDVVKGLLYEISRNASNGCAFEIKTALPTEIYRLVQDAGAPGKYAIPTEFIYWSPNGLLEVIAHRLMIFAKIRHPTLFERMCSHYPNREVDRPSSNMLNGVISEIFPPSILNEVNKEEQISNYLLRHSLMLPRQLLNLTSIALKGSLHGNKIPEVEPKQLTSAVDRGCDRVLNEVYSAYGHVYPDIGTIAPQFFRYCKPVATYGELQKAYNETIKGRHHHEYVNDFPSFLNAIVDCGLMGVQTRETSLYIEGKFAYNFVGELNFTSRDRLVLHPAASRRYSVDLSAQESKAILPFGSFVGEAV